MGKSNEKNNGAKEKKIKITNKSCSDEYSEKYDDKTDKTIFKWDPLRNISDNPDEALNIVDSRLTNLEKEYFKSQKDIDENFNNVFSASSVSRREFIQWTALLTSALMLPTIFAPRVARAANILTRTPFIWLDMSDCMGNTEAFLRTAHPTPAEIILNYVSVDYMESIMVPAGYQAEARRDETVKKYKGKYILVVEGAIPTGMNGKFLTIGAKGKTGLEITKSTAKNAGVIVAVGNCASYGGIPAAYPNPTGSVGLSSVTNRQVINIPACPANPVNLVGTLVEYILVGKAPMLDSLGRPLWAYSGRLHDNCYRRGHFEAGEYVKQWGDDGAKKQYCLYMMGCKGPFTWNNCTVAQYNQDMSFPMRAGHGCIGCSEPAFWDRMTPFEKPNLDAKIFIPGVEATADEFGVALFGAAGVGMAAHAIYTGVKRRKNNKEKDGKRNKEKEKGGNNGKDNDSNENKK
ncbi:MAG: hydrogenase [Candidatus Acididesulfobacter guangdongensis]|uniref:Hydrogenase n=1 Tax=Acididesulfobacter guangdongensis TaxID=2597225 RepID=A0A519BFJ1_ACIG2|nr:MAG: hydrogenase [Candidatus Acididesulfobacter guangdongensis]